MDYLLGFLNIVIVILTLFLIVLILIQRGKGGGLAGAFGGMGGSSAFGARTGDVFTKVTVGVAIAWILLSMLMVVLTNRKPRSDWNEPDDRGRRRTRLQAGDSKTKSKDRPGRAPRLQAARVARNRAPSRHESALRAARSARTDRSLHPRRTERPSWQRHERIARARSHRFPRFPGRPHGVTIRPIKICHVESVRLPCF